MKLIDCKLEKSLLVVSHKDSEEYKIIGSSKSTFNKFKNHDVQRIEPAPKILRDGTIEHIIFIELP